VCGHYIGYYGLDVVYGHDVMRLEGLQQRDVHCVIALAFGLGADEWRSFFRHVEL
jgi:hypothetical protein